MSFTAGLIIGGIAGTILGIFIMAALAVAGQSDRCSECMTRKRIREMAYSSLADDQAL
jgi:hypothetical protein